MKVIRRGVFETNSSSTHSLCIGEGDLTDRVAPDPQDGKVHVYSGEFGWEENTYRHVADRLSYAYTHAKDHPELLERLAAVIKKHTGCEVAFHDDDGYIDHQSWEVPQAAFMDDETLAQFLFCPKSYFVTDNDNH